MLQVSPAEFHTWAQQALNRVPGIQFPITHESHEVYSEYKLAVKSFQENYVGKANGVVDEKTYNALIKNNHIHPEYNKWIRQALAKAMNKPGLVLGAGHTEDLAKAVKEYQKSKSGLLHADGWVGVKTETLLAMQTGLSVPKPNPAPKVHIPIEVKVQKWLEQLAEDLRNPILPKDLQFVHFMHPDDRKSFVKFVEMLDLGTIDYRYIDAERVKEFLFTPGADLNALFKANARGHLVNLMRYYENGNAPNIYHRFALRCEEAWKDVDRGLFQAVFQQKNSSLDGITKGRTAELMDWIETRKRNPRHILSAWPAWKEWKGKWN